MKNYKKFNINYDVVKYQLNKLYQDTRFFIEDLKLADDTNLYIAIKENQIVDNEYSPITHSWYLSIAKYETESNLFWLLVQFVLKAKFHIDLKALKLNPKTNAMDHFDLEQACIAYTLESTESFYSNKIYNLIFGLLASVSKEETKTTEFMEELRYLKKLNFADDFIKVNDEIHFLSGSLEKICLNF